jgi:putative transposase
MARVIVPHCPHHIVQRGHNRKAVFLCDADYEYYIETLVMSKRELFIKVYSYCLMTNHVHLVVEPEDDVSAISCLMKRLAGRQTRYVNKLEGRTGSLWEGRYKISPIERSAYLLSCCRYVELNPVKAGIVSSPEDYRWSGFRSKMDGTWGWLDTDPCYYGLANTPAERAIVYKQFVSDAGSADAEALIRLALQRNQLTGGHGFIDEIEARLGIRVEFRGGGRPRLGK